MFRRDGRGVGRWCHIDGHWGFGELERYFLVGGVLGCGSDDNHFGGGHRLVDELAEAATGHGQQTNADDDKWGVTTHNILL